MIEVRKAGRPVRGTISLDKVILRRLELGPSSWTELMEAMPEGSARNDSSLKRALDRLIDVMLIKPEAVLKKGKAKTVYRLVKQHGSWLNYYEEDYPLVSWVEKTYGELFETRLAWVREKNRNGKLKITRKNRDSKKIPREIIENQGVAISKALEGLSLEILDFIKTSYELNEGSESGRRKYLEVAWDEYLSMIAMEISCLASPECGETMQAIQLAKEKLKIKDFEKHL